MKKEKFVPSGFFVVRTPLLPFDELVAWSEAGASACAHSVTSRGENDVDAIRQALLDWLMKRFDQPDASEALFLASPSLHEQRVSQASDSNRKKRRKLARSLTSYFLRMTSRPTPFGLFAGTSVGKISNRTHVRISARDSYRRHSRFDMEYLSQLTEAQQRAPAVRHEISFFPNNGLYCLGDRLHYAEARSEPGGRSYHLVTVEVTDYLLATLQRARTGATVRALSEGLAADDDDISPEEAAEFIDELIDSQLLVPDLGLKITGPEPINSILKGMSRYDSLRNEFATLDAASDALQEMDRNGVGNDVAGYRRMVAQLESLPVKVDTSKLWQVDLHKPLKHGTLNASIVNEIIKATRALHKITVSGETPLSRFAEKFADRYEGEEVPLIEALDEERGIGFDQSRGADSDHAPLLKGLMFPPRHEAEVRWPLSSGYLLKLVGEALRKGDREIRLTAGDLDRMATAKSKPLPNALAAMVRIAGESEEAVNQGAYQLLIENISGPSGAVLLGRFCHGDAEIERIVRDHLRLEERARPDAIFAEIVHLPEGRIGNVLLRPTLRDHEIPYLGESGVESEKQIPITDLYVSRVNGAIILRSKRLNREIIPRLTCAHNFSRRTLGIYRFLCSLQSQGYMGGLRWDWGPLVEAAYLPRVTHGRAVLSRARWLVFDDEIKRINDGPAEQVFERVQTWRKERDFPRWIVLTEYDNELPIDLDNVMSVETFVGQIRNRRGAILHEMFPPPDELWVTGPEGRYVSQFVIPLTKESSVPPEADPSAVDIKTGNSSEAHAIQRSYPPGAAWATIKFYSGSATTDKVLVELVKPVMERLGGSGAVDRWFFVRYADPHWHLRLRVHGAPEVLRNDVLPLLDASAQGWVESGGLWRVQYDTYVREIERYGGALGIEPAEQIFHADSVAVLNILETLSGDEGADARWQLALCGADGLLSVLGFDLSAKRRTMDRVARAFADEFEMNAVLRGQLGGKFRAHRALVEILASGQSDIDHPLAPGVRILHRRNEAMREAANELLRRADDGLLTTSLDSLAGSFIHMHVNRLLRSNQRAHEVVLYFLLARHYDACAAQRSQKKEGASS